MSKRITTEQMYTEVIKNKNQLEDLEIGIAKLQETLSVIVELMAPQDNRPDEVEEPETMRCTVHGVSMKRRDGPYGTFYNHGKQIGPGRWVNCQGNGFKMNKLEE